MSNSSKKRLTSRDATKLAIFAVLVMIAVLYLVDRPATEASGISGDSVGGLADDKLARSAFSDAATVFFSPRCSNCHPSGDAPTQGDTMITHSMDVKRGTDGRGVGELKCAVCHQDINLDGDNMPPGATDWHMPGAEHKMSFRGITVGQLCRNLKDPLMNGGRKTAKDAVEHISTDPKVLWAWSPGNGRTTPPLGQAEFLKKMNEWVANGAACPE